MNPIGAILRALIRAYQLTIPALTGPSCRYAPSCSDYAREAIAVHGALAGTWLALKRVARCHPWGGSGFDPVPPQGVAPGRPVPLRHGTCGHEH